MRLSGSNQIDKSGRHFTGDSSTEWKVALFHATIVSLFMLGLLYYWFAVANRYVIFLYEHLGAGPFDEVTVGRYWMAGVVASGAVMVLYTPANWMLGRGATWLGRAGYTPAWWRVWLFCILPLAIGIPAITMTQNYPTLPLSIAIMCTAAAVTSLAVALTPGSWAARRPWDLVWLTLDGAGLIPVLLLLRALELPSRGLISTSTAYMAAVGGLLACVAWVGFMTGLRVWRRQATPDAPSLLVAGVCLGYLLMPVVHYLFFTPAGSFYISASANYFAQDLQLQVGVMLVAGIVAVAATRLRGRLR